MSYPDDHIRLIDKIGTSLKVPKITDILLPHGDKVDGQEDEFGFVILEDGSVGPFYVCLGDTRDRLAETQLRTRAITRGTLRTAEEIGSPDLPTGALAIGAFNALSQHLMRMADFDPSATISPPSSDGIPVKIVGMVGYFPPLVERYLAKGCTLVVVEQKPGRVPGQEGVELHTTPDALRHCDRIICTASTLINGTLDEILSSAGPDKRIDLIGPSASGLPDPLFACGIQSVGGILIDRPGQLRSTMEAGEKWGDCGRKYQLTAENYPGIEALLAGI